MVKPFKKKYAHRGKILQIDVRNAIKDLQITSFTRSWRDATSECGMICNSLGRKNNEQNRLRIRGIIDFGIREGKKKEKTDKKREKINEGQSGLHHVEDEEFKGDQIQTLKDEDSSVPDNDSESPITGKRKTLRKNDSHANINTHTSSSTTGNASFKDTYLSGRTNASKQHAKVGTSRTMKLPKELIPLRLNREGNNGGTTYRKTVKEYSSQFISENIVTNTTVTYQNKQANKIIDQEHKQKEKDNLVSIEQTGRSLRSGEVLTNTFGQFPRSAEDKLIESDSMLHFKKEEEKNNENEIGRQTDTEHSLQSPHENVFKNTTTAANDRNEQDKQLRRQEQRQIEEDSFKLSFKKADKTLTPSEDLLGTKDNYALTSQEELVENGSSIQFRRKEEKNNESKTGRRIDKGNVEFSSEILETDTTVTVENELFKKVKDKEQHPKKADDVKETVKSTERPLTSEEDLIKTKGYYNTSAVKDLFESDSSLPPAFPEEDVTKTKDHYVPCVVEDLIESDSNLPSIKLRRNRHKNKNRTDSMTVKGYSAQLLKDNLETDTTVTDENEQYNQLKDKDQYPRRKDDVKEAFRCTKRPLTVEEDLIKTKGYYDTSAVKDLFESDSSLPPAFPEEDVTKTKDYYVPCVVEDLMESDSSLPSIKLKRNRHKNKNRTDNRTDKGFSVQFSNDNFETDTTVTDQNKQLKGQKQNPRKEDNTQMYFQNSGEEEKNDKMQSYLYHKPDEQVASNRQMEHSSTEGETDSETDTESYTYTSNEYCKNKGPMANVRNEERQQRSELKGSKVKTTYQSKFEEFSRDLSLSNAKEGDRHDDISEEGQHRQNNYIDGKEFCPTTLEYAFGPAATNEYFEKQVPSKGDFKIKPSQWQELCKTKKKRCFARGSWEHIISDGIRKTNPYCVYIFHWHKVSIARKRPTKTPLFSGKGECKFGDCRNKCKFSMDKSYRVSLEITPEVKHRMNESHARPISGELRQKTKEEFNHGQKPYKHYLDKIRETPLDVKIAGNFSNFGTTTRTFQQISSESKYQNKLDKCEFESLCLQAQNMKDQILGGKVCGFIQHIAVLPPYVMYWTEMGIRIWHDMAKSSTVYWDATGSLLSHRTDKLKYYYYELACVNPVAGQPVIPVSSMISSLHSTALVRFWLAEFRRTEKKIYGHANASIPHQVNSDRSMAFIQASLSEFNNENLNTFRHRAYRLVTGAAKDDDFDGTFPHACLSHVMGSFRKIVNDHYETNYDFGMYCFSILLNSATLIDLEERLKAIYHVLSSTVLDKKTLESFDYIQGKVATLDMDIDALTDVCTDSIYLGDEQVAELFAEETHPDCLTEEDFDMRSTRNEFCSVANNILQTVRSGLNESTIPGNLPRNKRYSPVLLEKIHKLYIPTIPLWTNLLLGDLTRHGTTKVYKRKYPSDVIRGNTKIEKRFQILKYIELDGKTTKRLDEISVKLKNHIIAVQELAVLKYIKPGHRLVTRKGRSTKTIEESWDKKHATTKDKQLIGKYQKTPSAVVIKNLKDKSTVTPKKTVYIAKSTKKVEVKGKVGRESDYQNTDKTADIQTSLIKEHTELTCNLKDHKDNNSKYLQEIYKDMDRECNDPSYLQLVKDSRSGLPNVGESCWFNSVVQMFSNTKFMRNINEQFQIDLSYEENIRTVLGVFDKVGKGKEVTRGDLQNALNDLYTLYGLETEQQHDAHEFVQTAIQHFMELYGDDTYIKVKESYICTSCGDRSGIGEQIYNDLQLSIGDDVEPYEDIQDLLNRYFSDEEIDLTCCEDNKKWRNVRLLNIPADLSICVVRHGMKNNRAIKNSKPISINRIINMGKYMHPQSDVFYRLTGVVMHHGAGARKGHYTYVKEDGGKPVLFDDAAISIFDSNRILTDGYLFQYELIPDDDNICHHSLSGVFHAIKETMGWSEIDNSVPFTLGLSVRKKELLQLIEKLEISNDNIHNSWKIYKLLQESIGPATFYNGEDYLQEVIKAGLEYFCRNCPNVLQRAFGLTTIRHAHCASCNFKSTHNQHDIITDIDELQPVHTYLSTASKSTCTVCGEKSLTEEKYITKIGNTVIVTGFLDMIYPKSLQQLGAMYSPRAFLSPSGTILFRGKDNNVLPLLLEESGSLINISSDDISSTLQDTTNPCIFLLDRRSDIEVLDPLYKLIEANGDFQIDSETLSLSIPAEDISLIEKFTAPFTSGSLKLEKDDVDRFLHKDFSDKNIDAFCHTLTKEDNCIIMPAAWYHDSLSSLQKEFTWFDKKCIMIPANVRQNHWILIVIRPAERTMYYLDPLAMEPITEVLDRVCSVLNNQCVLETFTSVKGH